MSTTTTTTTTTTTEPTPTPTPGGKAAPMSRSQLRHVPLPNVENARMLQKRLFNKTAKQIIEYAERFGVTEPSIVDRVKLEELFREFAAMLLVHFAKKVLNGNEGGGSAGSAPSSSGAQWGIAGKWNASQAERVRMPFEVYGLLDGENERKELDPSLENASDRLRDAILTGSPDFEYLTTPHGERFLQASINIAKIAMPDGLNGEGILKAALATLGSCSSNAFVKDRPETVKDLVLGDADSPATYTNPVRCGLTWRELCSEDRVLRARIEISTIAIQGEADPNKADDQKMVYELAVDYALLKERRAPDAPPLPDYLAETRISDLMIIILNYTAAERWLVTMYDPHIQQICECAEGNISSEVLEGQRKRNAERREKGGSAKNTVVLKINKPMQLEMCVEAFRLGTSTCYSLEKMNHIFAEYMKHQVQFLVACRCLTELQQQQQ